MATVKMMNHKTGNVEERDAVEAAEEFMGFLTGTVPPGFHLKSMPKLTRDQAATVIYVLQEHWRYFPDQIEQCRGCGSLFDSYSDGTYVDDDTRKATGGKVPKRLHGSWHYECLPVEIK